MASAVSVTMLIILRVNIFKMCEMQGSDIDMGS